MFLLTSAIGVASLSAVPPEDDSNSARAREDAELLITGVETTYDCKFSLEAFVSSLEPIGHRHTVMVQFDGTECEDAFRALKLRSIAFPFRFLELRSTEDQLVEDGLKDNT